LIKGSFQKKQNLGANVTKRGHVTRTTNALIILEKKLLLKKGANHFVALLLKNM
jgi:hypothetical protein